MQSCNGFGRPGVTDAVLAEGELANVRQQAACVGVRAECLTVHTQRVGSHSVESDAANSRRLSTEILAQQFCAQADRLENLRAAVRADGADAHFAHNLEQALVDGLDVVVLRGLKVEMNLVAANKVVNHGESHIRVDGACTVAQQQRGVHNLANLAALNNQSRLHTFLNRHQIMVDGAHRQKRRNGRVTFVDIPIGQDDIVDAAVNRLFGAAAKVGKSLAHTLAAFRFLEDDRQLFGVEALVADVAKGVEFCVGEHRLRQTHHFAVRLVWCQNVHSNGADVLRERHYKFLADWVDWRVGNLRKLLAEIVEQQLLTAREHGQLRVVTH